MKKTMKLGLTASLLLAGFVTTNPISTNKIKAADNSNYLYPAKNYYTDDDTINKGILSDTLAVALANDQATLNRLKETYGESVADKTLLEFYMENGYAPEDRYTSASQVTDSNGRIANATTRDARSPLTTFEFPVSRLYTNLPGDAAKLPGLFSRLTVGARPNIFTNQNYEANFSNMLLGNVNDLEVMQNLIGYGWRGTVDDFILNKDGGYDNNITIPTRFNSERDDVFLTMRGNSPDRYGSFLTGARVFLQATSADGIELDDGNVNDDNTRNSSHYYINTTTKVGITDAGFQSLGRGKWAVAGQGPFEAIGRVFEVGNQQLVNKPISTFNTDLNTQLESVEQMVSQLDPSTPRRIAQGVGGQIQLRGLYRVSQLDESDYLASEADRIKDATHTTNVEYYIYHAPTNELFSPNKSKFALETTRPYFNNFGDLTQTVTYDANRFNETLGYGSFDLTDDAVLPDGFAADTDKQRVRVRVDVDGNIDQQAITIDELNQRLSSGIYANKTIRLIYTYAATEAQDSIVGLLPSEIPTNTGAYAVPIARQVRIPGGEIVVTKVDSTDNTKLLEGVTFNVTGANGEVLGSFTTVEGGIGRISLPLGNYKVSEANTVDGYKLSSETFDANLVNDGDTVRLTITNEPISRPLPPREENLKPLPPTNEESNGNLKEPVDTADNTAIYMISLGLALVGLSLLSKNKIK